MGDISYPSYTLNRLDNITFPGGNQQSYQNDILMRIEQISASTLNYAYSYDNVSNILTKNTEHGNYGYGYDDVSRLLTVDNPVVDDEAFTYDGVGNRETASNVTTGSITHNANNELTVYGDISYDYDANGNMIRKSIGSAAVNYIYDAANRLIRVEDDATQTVIAEYYYDPFGRRLWKDVGGTRTYFLYADEGVVAEYDEIGAELRSYGYQLDSVWTTDPLWLKIGASYYWYQNDHLGTPQKLVDSTGIVVWSVQYSAFGEAVVDVTTITNNLRFPGQYADDETGLYYNYFRYYDPKIGRYLRVDPIGLDDGDINLYVYVNGNPVMTYDPKGLEGTTNATWADVLVCGLSPIQCLFTVRPCKKEALAEVEKTFHRPLGNNDNTNAFFHCYWNCCMVRKIGQTDTRRFANAHEESPKQPRCEKVMDVHNNQVGRNFGLAQPDVDCSTLCAEKYLKIILYKCDQPDIPERRYYPWDDTIWAEWFSMM